MIKQFIVRTFDDNSNREQVKTTVKATLVALGMTDPRVLVTHTHSSEFEVVIALDETITVE